MPWTKNYFPVSMKNLADELREKAIEIGNALVEENKMEEGMAIATAISRAKDWAANRGMDIENSDDSNSTDAKEHGKDRYVIPYENAQWAIKEEGNEEVEKIFEKKEDAVKEARKKAKQVNGILTIQKRTGKVQRRISYNPGKKVKV